MGNSVHEIGVTKEKLHRIHDRKRKEPCNENEKGDRQRERD